MTNDDIVNWELRGPPSVFRLGAISIQTVRIRCRGPHGGKVVDEYSNSRISWG